MASINALGVLVTDLVRSDGPYTDLADEFVHQTCVGCGKELQGSPHVMDRGYRCRECLIGVWPRRQRS